jgi:squalene-associated FAD-dependent desaturase
MNKPTPTAVVVGGGLAGITAALRLSDAGLAVTLVEGRPRLGGLAFSFQRGDLMVDNGQHVFLRCCTAYRGLVGRLGANDKVTLQRRLGLPVLDAAQHKRRTSEPLLGTLSRTALPVPLHLALSLARYPYLSSLERRRVVRATLALRRLDLDDPALDDRSFGDWLRRYGQSPRALQALWDLVGVATLNATADQVSLALAAKVFKTALLSEPGAADIGWANVPLGEIHHAAALEALRRGGVDVQLRARAVELKSAEVSDTDALSGGEHARHVVKVDGERGLDGGQLLRADVVVLAVPQDAAADLLPPDSLTDQERIRSLGTLPILNVHVIYDRKVLGRPFVAAIGTPIQWVFDRTGHSRLAEQQPNAQYIALSQSAAGDEIGLPAAELRARYLPELERLLPAARGAAVLDFFVTRERTATFDPAPGTARIRPGTRTRIQGLLLAGSWTSTGWPATMESAVRSGHYAADEALTVLGTRPAGPASAYEMGEWPR